MILLCFDFLVCFHCSLKVPRSSACTIRIYRQSECGCSVRFHFVAIVILTRTVQRAPDCDMALVHDDDLERILEAGSSDGTVSKKYT